ncbi:MAG: hypothetical protein ABJA62_01740 [Luteimonas sp.]
MSHGFVAPKALPGICYRLTIESSALADWALRIGARTKQKGEAR